MFNRINILFFAVVLLVTSCTLSQIQLDQDSQEAIAKMTARQAGYALQVKHPNLAEQVDAICRDILTQEKPDLVKIAAERLAAALATKIDDPVYAADIRDVLDLVETKTEYELDVEHIQTINAIAVGLIGGIEIGKTNE